MATIKKNDPERRLRRVMSGSSLSGGRVEVDCSDAAAGHAASGRHSPAFEIPVRSALTALDSGPECQRCDWARSTSEWRANRSGPDDLISEIVRGKPSSSQSFEMGSFSSRCRLRSPLNAKGCQKWTQARYQTRNQFYGLPTTDRAKVPSGTQDYLSPNRSFAVSWVHTFSPTLFNELLVTGTRTRLDNSTGDPPVCYDCALGVPNPFNVNQWPGLYDAGFNSNYYFETQNASGFYAYYGLL